MTPGDFDPFRPARSEEVDSHAFEELILAADWTERFRHASTVHTALGRALATAQDPAEVMTLVELRNASLVAVLGAGALNLWQRDVLDGRRQFAAEFGQ